jgi:hypothetical protein
MSFYVTLLSDTRDNGLASNVQNNFTTFLTPPLELNGNWEVALTEMTCANGHKVNLGTITLDDTESHILFYEDGMSINQIAKAINTLLLEKSPNADIYDILSQAPTDPAFLKLIKELNTNKDRVTFIRIDNKIIITCGNDDAVARSMAFRRVILKIEQAKSPDAFLSMKINTANNYTIIILKDPPIDEATLTSQEITAIAEHKKLNPVHKIVKRELDAEIIRIQYVLFLHQTAY